MAGLIRDSHLRTIVLNLEDPAHDIGLPQQLADALGGPCYTLAELSSATLAQTVRDETRNSRPAKQDRTGHFVYN